MALWLVSCCALLGGCGFADSDSERDGKVVHCLSGSARHQVVDAAVVLELARQTGDPDQVTIGRRQLTLEQWRKDRPEDFDRACDAYLVAAHAAAPNGSSRSGDSDDLSRTLLTTVLSLLVAVLTAVITGVVTVWLGGADRRRKLAKELRSAAHAFRQAGTDYVESFQGDKPRRTPSDLFAARSALSERLREVEEDHPHWLIVPAVRAALAEPPLDNELYRRMNQPSQQAVEESRDEVAAAVEERATDALRLASAIERPVSFIRRLRGDQVSKLGPRRAEQPTGGSVASGDG